MIEYISQAKAPPGVQGVGAEGLVAPQGRLGGSEVVPSRQRRRVIDGTSGSSSPFSHPLPWGPILNNSLASLYECLFRDLGVLRQRAGGLELFDMH